MRMVLPVLLLLAGQAFAALPGAPPDIRIGGGNIRFRGDPAKLKVLQDLGAGMCRIPIGPREYWDAKAGKATPERMDEGIRAAHRHGVTPMILFEYYTRWKDVLGDGAKWRAIGGAFAGRFRPNSPWLVGQGIRDWGVTFYSAVNEPMWRANNPRPIPPDAYAAAIEGLADGVHGVDPALKVSPGGYQEVPLFQNKNPYIKAVAPLYNKGRLFAIDIHRYWDVDHVPMRGRYGWSLQSQFEKAKREAGITADVAFYTTEMNFKKREVTEEEAARGFLTALWDALTVTGADGRRVTQFVLPWNIFHTAAKDDHYGLCTTGDPWTPNARGRVLRTVCRLTRGMTFVSVDPKRTGVTVMAGAGRKLWVWQNRKAWTREPGTSFALKGVPAGAKEVEVYGWDGLRKRVPVTGGSVTVAGLVPEQTYMFYAVAE